MKNCTPLWREAHFEVKMYKTPQRRTTFGSCDVEKVHAVVARSTFPSENVQNTPWSDHFWQLRLRCRKSARRCGAKHISKSKYTKHHMFAPLLAVEIEMSKKCTLLWREAHLEVKMYKTHHVRTTFGGSDVVSRGRCKGLCTLSKVSKREGFVAFSTTTTTTPHYTPIHYTTLQLQLHLHYILLHYTPLHYTAPNSLNYTTLHYITLHYTTLHYNSPHYSTLHSTTLQLQLQNYTPLHSTTLNYTPLH